MGKIVMQIISASIVFLFISMQVKACCSENDYKLGAIFDLGSRGKAISTTGTEIIEKIKEFDCKKNYVGFFYTINTAQGKFKNYLNYSPEVAEECNYSSFNFRPFNLTAQFYGLGSSDVLPIADVRTYANRSFPNVNINVQWFFADYSNARGIEFYLASSEDFVRQFQKSTFCEIGMNLNFFKYSFVTCKTDFYSELIIFSYRNKFLTIGNPKGFVAW
jgi:hypothetical protein